MNNLKHGTWNEPRKWRFALVLIFAIGCLFQPLNEANASPSVFDSGAEYEPPPWSIDLTTGTESNPILSGIIIRVFF